MTRQGNPSTTFAPPLPSRSSEPPAVPPTEVSVQQNRVTIKEIARITGVSVQTVSRVLNKRPDVSQRTREAVEAAILETGFRPSEVARSLVQRRSRMIGVIAAGLEFYGVGETVNGIVARAEASGYSLILKELGGYDVPDFLPVIESFAAQRAEGIVFAAPELEGNVRRLQDQLPPTSPPVVFLKASPSPGFTTIGFDNRLGGRRATEHLIALGRRRIAHLAGPLAWREARDRRDGWRDALEAAGLEPGPLVPGDWLAASGAAAFERILAADPSIDGLFAGSDLMALGALHVANARGIRIPERLAVVGFDGLPAAAQFTPSLTTIRQPLREIGMLAVDELLAHLGEDVAHARAREIRLETELIVGESAPVAGSPGRGRRD